MIGNLDVGGAERHLAQVLPQLSKRGFKLLVYTTTHKGKLAPVLEAAGVKVIEPFFAPPLRKLPALIRKPLLLFLWAFAFCFFLLRRRPAIVHFFLPEAYLMGGICSLVSGKRIRIMSRRSLNRYQLKYPVLAKTERWLHSRMDAVLGNSSAVIKDLQDEGVPAHRLGLLYNGIDFSQFSNLPARGEIRKSLNISDDTLLIVCVANLIPYKGHADLIHALGVIHKDLPSNWVVAMVGRDTGLGAELRALAESVGVAKHILWLGERSDSISIYSTAEIGVLCSHEEGFSNSVLEGMASKIAMVVTDVGGNTEAVLDGECGIVVPARNPELLGEAILTLSKDKGMRDRMGRLAYQRVRDKFSLDACVSQYASLYDGLLHDPKGAIQPMLDAFQSKES